MVYIFTLLPQFHIAVFIECLAIYGPRSESLMSHFQVRMNEAEMLYFHSKLPDPARGTNLEHLGNVFVFVWAYKI